MELYVGFKNKPHILAFIRIKFGIMVDFRKDWTNRLQIVMENNHMSVNPVLHIYGLPLTEDGTAEKSKAVGAAIYNLGSGYMMVWRNTRCNVYQVQLESVSSE